MSTATHRKDSVEGIPDEPPPAYSQVVSTGDMSVQHGPSRPDFSGPPPLPDRLNANITGVGIGYGPRYGSVVQDHSTGASNSGRGGGNGNGGGGGLGGQGGGGPSTSPNPTGSSNPFSDHAHLPPPPSKSGHETYASVAHDHSQSSSSSSPSAGSSRPSAPVDLSPTETPTPGRPLLHRGMMLVYPVGFHCHKCGNTGYKANDPSNPHASDWRKYGRKYNGALAASYASATGRGNGNPNAQASSNFQRPLPVYAPPTQGYAPSQPQAFQPPPAKWNAYPGHNGQQGGYGGPLVPPPPPPPPGVPYHVYAPPPGALVLQAGDPRIGGQLCWRCGGSGREMSFFGFDDGKCWQCKGVGRVF